MRREAAEVLTRLTRIGTVDARVKALTAERRRLRSERSRYVQQLQDQRFLARHFAEYTGAGARAEMNRAALKVRHATSTIRALDMLLALNRDDLRRLAAHREALRSRGKK
jgi:hypothetical protein